ncbi:MAG TPA: hypothetical protein VFS96_04615 [Nitrolancea sp.]|nr:hypothetical protein [Nitrolancea sp.]
MTTSIGWGWGGGSDLEDNATVIKAEQAMLLATIQNGMTIYDDRNHRIGTVRNVSRPVDATGTFYVKTHTGFLAMFGHDVFIPSRMITLYRESDSRMELAVGVKRAEIDKMGWDRVGPLVHD